MVYHYGLSEFKTRNLHGKGEKNYKDFERALYLIKDAVEDEKKDEKFYDYLINKAPTKEEKEIITHIRNDEKKHNKMFREIYYSDTGIELDEGKEIEFEGVSSYMDGIKKAFFGELAAVEKYRDIKSGLPHRMYRDMLFEIITDELEHSAKYNYIMMKNNCK